MISKINGAKRCGIDNIQEMTGIFKRINDEVKKIVDKILADGTRPEETKSRGLQLLLKMQDNMSLLPIEPGSRVVQTNLYENQCHRVRYLREMIKEIERRYKFKILDDF